MAERGRRVEKYCRSHNQSPQTLTNTHHLDTDVPFVSVESKFFFCPVSKSASTFWNRFVLALSNSSGPMRSPYTIPLTHDAQLPKVSFASLGSAEKRARFLETALKVLFVRDPYDRWYSTFVDKVFAPNPYYWQTMAGYTDGPSRRRKREECRYRLSLAQVITNAYSRLRNRELHFIPAFRRCRPCQFHYDVIGKMETFSEDVKFISLSVNHSEMTQYVSSDAFRYEYVRDAIEDSIHSPFQWLPSILVCMSKMEMGLRIWRKLQIRGFIDRRILFPYSAGNFSNVGADELVKVALQAHSQSKDKLELKRQKRDAFIEAYRSVDKRELKKLAETFRADFDVFGYDIEPDFLNSEVPLSAAGAFDWSKPWILNAY